jgi:hypothetical protein
MTTEGLPLWPIAGRLLNVLGDQGRSWFAERCICAVVACSP